MIFYGVKLSVDKVFFHAIIFSVLSKLPLPKE
jgi:hypothetical protein